jgi:diguanylate cyclase (GGDEF)-like protein/PAS domain S-box-containing protein
LRNDTPLDAVVSVTCNVRRKTFLTWRGPLKTYAALRVLLVDDDTPNALRISRMLRAQEQPPFRVSIAPDIDGAAALIGRDPCDVILLNLAACGMPGVAACALLQTFAPDVPLIVMERAAEEAAALRAVQQGAADCLIIDQLHETLLVRTIRYVREQHEAERKRRRAEQALRESERRYRSLFEQLRDAIFITDADYTIVETNRAAVGLLGYAPADLRGMQLQDLCYEVADGLRIQQQLWGVGWTGDVEMRVRCADGSLRWCLFSAARRLGDDGTVLGYQGIIHDITDRKHVEERLLHDALHDPLTGLPNRALFADRVDMALARWRRNPRQSGAVLFVDLDRFKVINDSLGHATGDALLRRIADALTTCLRAEDTVARLGGDEFAILLHTVSESDALTTAERIQNCFTDAFEIGEHRVFASASIGLAFPSSADDTPQDLLRNADLAMYRAKSGGPGRHEVFAPAMHRSAVDLLQLENDLRHAVAAGDFVLHYQPILSLPDQRVVGFEALVRWPHARRGMLAPRDFIPIAEETGLIVPLGWWVMREACRQGAAMMGQLLRPPFIGVNVSARQLLLPDFTDGVLRILAESGLPPRLLTLEITESTLVSNAEEAAETLARLRAAGVHICIDDFGTGYSSLSYLHTFRIDGLKIDRSFISRLDPDGDRAELVQTIIGLARRLGITTVAEGVETYEQLSRLTQLEPTSVQGFLFSRPVDAAAAVALLDMA